MRHVAVQVVVRRGLVGDDVRENLLGEQALQQSDGIHLDPDRDRLPPREGLARARQASFESRRPFVEIALLEPLLDPRAIDLRHQADALVHRHCERLGAAHAAQACRDREAAGEAAAEVAAGKLSQSLEGSLEDPLGSDVDPRAGGHLAVHRQAEPFETAKFVDGGPSRHQIRVGDQHSRSIRVALEDRHRFAGLHHQGFVVFQAAQGGDDGIEAVPVSRRPARPAVDDQLVRPLGDFRVEVVHQHAQGRFLQPALAGDRAAARSADDPARCASEFAHERILAAESVFGRGVAAPAFAIGLQFLGAQPPDSGGAGGAGRATLARRDQRPPDELLEPLDDVLSILLLGTMALAQQDDLAFLGGPAARQREKADLDLVGQRRRAAHVEAQPHRGRDLVDVLPARSRGTDELERELLLGDFHFLTPL